MKIPTSSSILLATLAISSSSSCLAAPTGGGGEDTGVTSSSSFSTSSVSAAYPTGMNAQERSDTIVQGDANFQDHLVSRDGLPDPVVKLINDIPIVGSIIAGLLNKPAAVAKSLDVDNSGSGQSVDPQQMEALRNAVVEVTRLLSGALGSLPTGSLPDPVKGAAGTVNSTLPVSAMSDDGGSGPNSADPANSSSSAYAPGPTESAAASDDSPAADPSASASWSSASAAPSSPSVPGNPPNSPALPVNM